MSIYRAYRRIRAKLKEFRELYYRSCEKKRARRAQKRLVNKGFTLITSTCVGGYLYHMLGQKFESPTINTWISQPEFCKMCGNLRHYLEQPLIFYNEPTRDCPCARLDDITVVFVHYKTEKEAREKWEFRLQRIHWDNLYIITSDGNGAGVSDFQLVQNAEAKRRVIFTASLRPEIEDSFFIDCLRGEDSAAIHQIRHRRTDNAISWELDFDYVAWLNDEADFRRKRFIKCFDKYMMH